MSALPHPLRIVVDDQRQRRIAATVSHTFRTRETYGFATQTIAVSAVSSEVLPDSPSMADLHRLHADALASARATARAIEGGAATPRELPL